VSDTASEIISKRRDGSTFPRHLTVSELILNGQRMFAGIVRDITARKRVERLKSALAIPLAMSDVYPSARFAAYWAS
jgi:hypothetical protein